jgi:hypothetical protein
MNRRRANRRNPWRHVADEAPESMWVDRITRPSRLGRPSRASITNEILFLERGFFIAVFSRQRIPKSCRVVCREW